MIENINIHNRNLKIICDMDSVVVDLDKYVIEERYNKDFDDNMKAQDNKSYWWGDCKKAPKSYFEQLLLEKGTFINPKPVKNSVETLNKLHKEGFKIIFCTYPQYNSDYCIKEKIQWLQKYFKWFNVDKHIVFTGDKSLVANKNRILLDDNLNHIKEFDEANGFTCIWIRGWNEHENKGFRVDTFDKFYNLVNQLEDVLLSINYFNS